MSPIDAIVLSAGRASRFGVPKFLLPAGQGHILLTRVLEHALRVADGRIAVVLGREARVARFALQRWLATQPGDLASRVFAVLNRHYRYGQSTSLKAGMRALADAQGVLVFLADMPAQEPEKLTQLKRAIHHRDPQKLAVVASEQGQMRPPVFLSRQLFPEVLKLKGDQGARAVLNAHQEKIERVEWGSGPWFFDIDDWQTYRELAWKLGWANELFVSISRERISTSAIQARVDAALASETAPWLAPGLLLLAAKSEARWLELSLSYRGVRGVILGPAQTPAAYLELVRWASLAALAENK
ncbi:nucleotidyltransferase family protein [Meiothermus hypogaeus]|uniref:Purine catabolism protein PucB n=1 Tax=Meiothermus hypogaeus TaxID=884155 RepID=A0ABX9MRU9_9DEIN|nr:nucleotidyltransferase family protein [Meiothermus hypogaeus]RIH81031.1 Purine catabolism protein PucB [Meiothermus hypogaeus]